MRHTRGKLAASALALCAVLGSNPCSGKITDEKASLPKDEVKGGAAEKPEKAGKKETASGLITCILDGGLWQDTVRQGDVLLPRFTDGMARVADVYAIYVQDIKEGEVKLNISKTDDPGRPAGYRLKFGEMKGIGKGAKLGVEAQKKSQEGMVGLTLTLNAEAAPMKADDAAPFEEKPSTIFYIFDSNGFVTKVQEGEIVFGFELEGLFDAAGVRTIKIRNVQAKEIEIEVRMIDSPSVPVPLQLRFGEEKKIGAGKKLDVRAYKIMEPETVGVLLKAETFPIGDADFFSIRPCDFEEGICTSLLSEGSIVYSGAGETNVFEGAGLKSILVDKIGNDAVKMKIRMQNNPTEPVMMELSFGTTAEIGEGKEIKVTAEKGDEPKTVAMTIKSKDAPESGKTSQKNIIRNW